MYFIIFLYFHFVLHDDENYLDLINIDKMSLMVITNNYDTKKNYTQTLLNNTNNIYYYYYYCCRDGRPRRVY